MVFYCWWSEQVQTHPAEGEADGIVLCLIKGGGEPIDLQGAEAATETKGRSGRYGGPHSSRQCRSADLWPEHWCDWSHCRWPKWRDTNSSEQPQVQRLQQLTGWRCFAFVCLVCLLAWDRFSLCSPNYPGTSFGAPGGLELTVNAGITDTCTNVCLNKVVFHFFYVVLS